VLFASNHRNYKNADRSSARRLCLEPLEDRRLPSLGLGWAFNVGGTGQDAGTGITTDTADNVYVSGWFISETVNFDPNNTNPNNANNTLTNPTPGVSAQEFVEKYTSNQTFQWVTLLGTETGRSNLVVDGAGNLYVAYVDGSDNNNAQLVKLNAADGSIGWDIQFPGSSASSSGEARVAVGPSGDLYVTGRNSSSQAFVAQVDSSGNVLWNATTSGSAGGVAVAVDNSEHVYVTGGNSGPTTFGATSQVSSPVLSFGSLTPAATPPGPGASAAMISGRALSWTMGAAST
jgi:outer membrane protein assembly factor BamB